MVCTRAEAVRNAARVEVERQEVARVRRRADMAKETTKRAKSAKAVQVMDAARRQNPFTHKIKQPPGGKDR